VRVEGLEGGPFPGVFIRSPRIHSVGPEATPFAWHGSEAVGVRAGSIWGLTFHPELSGDPRVHRMFLKAAHAGAATATAGTAGSARSRRARR
jgi:5'-phosphate synthase pdxT subunit